MTGKQDKTITTSPILPHIQNAKVWLCLSLATNVILHLPCAVPEPEEHPQQAVGVAQAEVEAVGVVAGVEAVGLLAEAGVTARPDPLFTTVLAVHFYYYPQVRYGPFTQISRNLPIQRDLDPV